ncbi:MAG: secretin N-terminal domain-containing protein [Chthoniobacterales bacterium]
MSIKIWQILFLLLLIPALIAEEPNHDELLKPTSASAYDAINETRSEMEASGIPWRTPTFTIVAQNRPISDLMADFGDQQGIKTHVSPLVHGEISGSFVDKAPASFLAQMSKAYGLSWFYVNGILYIASNQEVNLVVRPLRYVKADAVLAMLRTSGFISSDGHVDKIKDSGMVTISGIPRYIELAQQLISSMDSETQFHNNGETVIEVFPLNNAWAYDVDIGGGGPIIRGVATTLRQLIWGYGGGVPGAGGAGGPSGPYGGSVNGALNKNGAPNSTSGGVPGVPIQMSVPNQSTGVLPPTSQQVPPGFAGNAPAMANSQSAQMDANGMPPPSDSPLIPKNSQGGPGSEWTYAMITADVRRNAVIIRDIRANMDLYEAAIRKLDVPVRVIEISAAIVDLQLGASRTLGLNSLAVNSGTFTSGTNTITLGGGGTTSTTKSNVGMSGVFGTAAVTAQINALSTENKAKILSRPTLLTLDNFGAMINDQNTFYVNAVGQYVSNLYNVSTGLSLQVVPHVTIYHGETRIYLQVQITDGEVVNGNTTTGIPNTKQSMLTTQSVIKEDQSLLIGGLYQKVNQKDASGYPWLYKIPVLGYLFGVKDVSKSMVERVFLITPRIVEVNAKNLGDYSEYFKPAPVVQEALETEKTGVALPLMSPNQPVSAPTNTPVYHVTTTGKNGTKKKPAAMPSPTGSK